MQDEIGAVVDLLTHPGFLTGLGIGLVVAMLLAGTVLRSTHRRGWGLAFVLATGLGVWIQFEVDAIVYLFVGALALIGLAGDVIFAGSEDRIYAPVAIGYWVVAFAATAGVATLLPLGEVAWAIFFLPLLVVGSGAGVWLLSRSDAVEVLGPMVAISIAGMWVTVPETDMITVLVGAAIPFGLATLPPIRATALVAGSFALSGTMGWVVFVTGTPRPWTIAAAWATLATLPLLGVLVRLHPGRFNVYVVGLTHLLYVVVVTRVADVTDSPLVVAISICVLLGLATATFLVALRVRSPAELKS